MSIFRRLYDWLTLADYDAALRLADRVIVARLARGNERMQEGAYMTRTELDALSLQADAALLRLRRKTA